VARLTAQAKELLDRLQSTHEIYRDEPLDDVIRFCEQMNCGLPRWAQKLLLEQQRPKRRGRHSRDEQLLQQHFDDMICFILVVTFRRDKRGTWAKVYELVGQVMHLSAPAVKKAYLRARKRGVAIEDLDESTEPSGERTRTFRVKLRLPTQNPHRK
jgi:hypothetical protein